MLSEKQQKILDTYSKEHDTEVYMILTSIEEKGIEKKAVEAAEKLIEKGCDDVFIQDVTGLSKKKIRALRDKRK